MGINERFIITPSYSIATSLTAAGFKEIKNDNGNYVFLNDLSLSLPLGFDKTQVVFSNILTFT